jgi:hypothetical protein
VGDGVDVGVGVGVGIVASTTRAVVTDHRLSTIAPRVAVTFRLRYVPTSAATGVYAADVCLAISVQVIGCAFAGAARGVEHRCHCIPYVEGVFNETMCAHVPAPTTPSAGKPYLA